MNWEDLLKSKYRKYDNIGLKSLYNNLNRGPKTYEDMKEIKAIMEELKRRGVKI